MQYFNLLRRPVPLLLWLGQVTSTAGDRLYAMAMLWIAYQLTGSTTTMAAVSLFESIPLALVGLVGGALVDRWDRLRTMIAIDAVRAVLVLALPAAYTFGMLQPWHLMAVGICMGALGALFDPALQATLPALVPPAQFPGLAGLMDTPSRLARMLGPGLAGVLLTLMPAVHFFTLDAATFAVSGLCLGMVALRWAPATPSYKDRPARNLRTEIAAGWRLVSGSRNLSAIFLVDGLGNVGFVAFTLGGLLLAEDVGSYGLLIAAYGAGSLLGNLTVGNLDLSGWRVYLSVGGWVGIGLGFALLGVTSGTPWALAAVALSGLSGSMAHVSRATYIGQTVPSEHLGKVYSFLKLWTTLCAAVGTLLCGWLLEYLPAAAVITGAGILMMLASGGALLGTERGHRRGERPGLWPS